MKRHPSYGVATGDVDEASYWLDRVGFYTKHMRAAMIVALPMVLTLIACLPFAMRGLFLLAVVVCSSIGLLACFVIMLASLLNLLASQDFLKIELDCLAVDLKVTR